MKAAKLILNSEQLNRLFPYYLLLNKDLQIEFFGQSFQEYFDLKEGVSFLDNFYLEDNFLKPSFDDLKKNINQDITLFSLQQKEYKFNGRLEYIEEDKLLFIGTPSPLYANYNDTTLNTVIAREQILNSKKIPGSENIQSQQNKFRFALEKIGDNVWEYDFNINRTQFSSSEISFLGYNVNDCSDINQRWWNSIHPDDITLVKESYNRCKTGEIDHHILEYRMIHKNGSTKWVLDKGVVIETTANGKPLKMIGTHTNITHIKLTEAALEQKIKQFQSLSENIPGVLFEYEVKPDGTEGYKYLSPAMERVFGINAENLYNIDAYRHPDDIAEMQKQFKYSEETLSPFYNESRLILPDGRIVWRSISCAFSYYTENKGKVFTGIMLDITQRKKTIEKLKESENRLSLLISNLQAGILVEDDNRRIVLANDLFCKMFFIPATPETLISMDCLQTAEQTKHLFKDPIEFTSRINELLNNRQLVINDILHLNDGRIFHRDYIPIYIDNIYKGHLWKYTDVTTEKDAERKLKIREEKYRSIIANMNLGLLEVDTDEKILYANQCFCEMCGYELEELVGKKASKLFSKGENMEMMESKNEARKKGISDAYEIAIKNKRGQLRWWLVSGAPRYDDNGQLVGSIGIHLDITDQKQLEIDLIDAREQAELSAKVKETFLANMSHEIRTPMNAILGMANQLAKTNLNDKQHFYLDTITSASENLLIIINDILDLSKIEAGKLTLEKIGLDLKAVIKRAMQVLMHKAEEKGLTISNSKFDDNTAPILIGDPYRLNQILLNLIGNAIKFTEKGSIDIRCTLLQETNNSQTILLEVEDTGIGMDETFVKNLFEKFTQEDTSITRQYGGTGLGMTISKDLIELMGGNIKVKSKKGHGTNISFSIEFEKGTTLDLPVKNSNFALDTNMLMGKKILIVDDIDINRLVATTILSNYGAITLEAANGSEAIDVIKEETIDLVLMDIQMPIMNGFEASQFIRQNITTELPIIALTANAIKGDNEKCFEAGMNDYISKPFKEEDLLKTISIWLDGQTTPILNQNSSNMQPISNLYDISGIQAISRGNNDFVLKIVKMFVSQTPAFVEDMKLKYIGRDLKDMAAVAHKIKPSIENMGIASLHEAIREIERLGKEENDSELLPTLLQQVENTLHLVIEALTKDFELANN